MSKIILSIGIFFFFHSVKAQTFNGTGGTIPDGGPQSCFNLTVSGVGNINGSYGLASVCINIMHAWDSDLDIYLQAPDGTSIPLSIGNGGSGDNYTNTCFTSTAATSITLGTAPFTGTFFPEGNLGLINNGQNANGTWSLCIEDISTPDAGSLVNWNITFNNTPALPPVPPANDNPCNATALTVSASCAYITATTANAGNSPGVPAPGCASYAGGDVWFSVTVPAGGALIFDTQTGVMTDGGMAIYSGNCNSLTLISCNDDGSSNGLMPMISAAGLTPGSTIWIRVWEYSNDNPGTFGICVTTPPPPPLNNEPCTAFSLPVSNTCNFSYYTNAGATSSPVPDPGCGDYQGADVWFSITVPPSGAVILDANTGTMTDADMAVYSGACNSLTLLACDDLSSLNGLMPSITVSGQTPGSTLWIRIWGYGSGNTGTFQLCATIPPPPTVQDCPAALAICQNVYHNPVAYSGTGSLPNEINENTSCLEDGERADVWYTFTVQSSGNLNFTITPVDLTEDYDWAVYNLTNATCSDIYSNPALNVSCNFSSTAGATGPTGGTALTNQDALGTPFNAQIPVVAGQTYVINVSNYSLSTNGYTIDFSASTASIFDNVPPQLQSMGAATSCGGNQVTVNFSENILCSTIQNADFSILGPGGPYTVTGWSSLTCTSGATYANNVVLTVSPALSITGNYQVCLTTAAGSVTDLCGNVAPSGCLNFTIATTVPAFTPVAPICSGSTAPVLPTTSNNGVTGTWSPATVSNTSSGTYTFTPTAGLCATTATLTITVTSAGITPTFNPVPAFCQGTVAPVLPTTSTNGITGSWSPGTVNNMASSSYTFIPNAGQCASLVTITVTVTSNTIPTFTAIPAFCSGSTAPALPSISNNGISGTWSPAIVSNTASGTYTFTPNPGQCATTASLNISVTNSTTPTFAIPAGLCAGASAPALPTISTNGISGTWSPAIINNTTTSSYTFTPTNGQCANPVSVTITVWELPVLYAHGTNPSCNNNCDGSATVDVVGGTGPYTYNWSNSAGTQTINNLCDGTYTVSVTDSHGCVATANSPVTGSCFQIQSTMVDACSPTEYDQEMVFFQIGQNPLNTAALSVSWPTAANSWNGLCNNAAFIASVNATITNGGIVLPLPVSGILPANANVVLITSTPPTSASSFANLSDTLYAMFQCPGNSQGHFSNNTGLPGIRTLSISFGAGCSDTTKYDPSLLINQNGTTGGNAAINNGAYVNYSAGGVASYLNYGCVIPYTIQTSQVTITGPPPVVPAFNLPAQYCQLSAPVVLPSTSTNGISGTWLPATISTATAGVTNYTFTPTAGQCATPFVISIVVNPTVTSITNISVCANQLPYAWNSQNYNSAGTYNVTLTSSAGCDSIATLNLSVNPTVSSSTSVSICDNQLPYSWNGNSFSSSGTYNVTLTSSAGCDSIATLVLNVNPNVTSTTNISLCSNQLPYAWNSQNYNSAGTYNVTLTSSAGCDSIATLLLNVNPNVTSTTNISVCSNQLPYAWNSQNYNSAGTYNVTLTSSAGCDSIATLILSVNNVLTSTTNISICDNQLPYSWNTQSYNNAGTYSITLTSSSGCDSIATLVLNVNPTVTSITNISVCANQLPYAWNSQNYNSAGTYNVTLTSSAGCDSIATLVLNVNPNVTSTTNISLCSNQLPYAWNSQNYNSAGTYNVTLTSSAGCDSIATLVLNVNPNVTSTTNISLCSNQLPYAWNSQNYNSAGTYNVTLTSLAGCDSIATLILSVNNVLTSTTNISICDNQLPYSWNGNSYTSAGSFNITLTSSAGCDSIATLNLSVNNVLTSTTNISICDNQLPYSWNGNSYSSAGSYNVTLTSSAGCDSMATLVLLVNPSVSSSTSVSICDNQLPYSWNGNSYSSAGSYNVTLTSSAGCDSIATLVLLVNPTVSSSTSVSICDNQLPYSWNGNTYTSAGSYNVTLTSSAGCDSIATLNLSVNNVLTSTSNITICDNQLPYSWNGNSYSSAGSYNVTLTSSAGCDSIATLILSVNNVLTSTSNITICDNQLPYSWNGNSYSSAGSYNVTLTSSAGCDSIATLILSVNNVLTSTSNITICDNQLPYSWNGNSYSSAGSYNVTLTSSAGCDSIATLNLSVNNVLTSTTNISICDNQLPYSWNGNSYTSAGAYNVTLISSAGCDSIATLNLSVNNVLTSTTNVSICDSQLPYSWNGNSYSSAGSYNVTLTSSVGCDSIATLNLSVNNVLTSTTNISICDNQLPYSWNANTFTSAGAYNVTLTSSVGCDSIATLNLSVNSVLTSTTNISICDNQLPYSWNANTFTSAGAYNVTLTSSAGCDSIATLNLSVNSVLTSTTNMSICDNQLPYSWNGNSYSSAGSYNITLASSAGCDSIATLNLSVNNVLTSTTNISICDNQLPYSWNGNSYTSAGAYNVTLTSSAGCDSIATLNLSVNNVLTSTTNVSICDSQLPYSWNGNSYSSAGSYNVTLTSSVGCDSIATLNLSVNSVLTSTTNISICDNQLPYSWNANTFTSAGAYNVTLTSSAGCDSIATLNLSVNSVLTSTTNVSICDNQLPYSWNANTFTSAGAYNVTLTSSAGCDSIATLILSVNNVLTSTSNITICDNQLPYSWNGNSYSSAGSYNVTLTSSAGCDSIATLILSVNNVLTSTSNITICDNQLPYSWNGNSYSSAGSYNVTLTSSAGCDSIATLNLSVNNVLTSTTNVSICDNQWPYSWNGNSYSSAGSYNVTLISSAGCDSIATLNLSVNNVLSSTTNISICDNQLPYSWNGNSYSSAGTYNVTLTSSAGCDSIATLILSVNNVLTSTSNITICDNQLPYTWNGNSYSSAGTYNVTLTSSAGCDSIATLNLSVNNVLTSTTNMSICDNQLPYSWNGNSYSSAGSYNVTLTSSAGCDSIATLILSVNNVLTSTSNITICDNQLPYTWNGNSYSSAGSYNVTLTSSAGCDSIATLNLSVNNVLTSTSNITICDNQLPYTWNGNSYSSAGTYNVTLTSSAGCDSIATLNLSVNNVLTSTTNMSICDNQLPYSWNGNSYSSAGSYNITLASSAGCDSMATLVLLVNPSVSSSTSISICHNQLPYSWNGNSYSSAGSYNVTLTSSAGCDSIATLNLSVNNVLTSTSNITICDNQLPYSWNGNSYSSAGSYNVTLTSSAGCDSMATLVLLVNPSVSSSTSVSICDNLLPYSWNGNSYSSAGSYNVTLTSSAGCDSLATLVLLVNPTVSSSTSVSICDNQLPYSWNGNSYSSAGSYNVTLTSSAGCDSLATLVLLVNPTASSTTVIAVCSNQLPFVWNGQSINSTGAYTATLTAQNGCDSVATLQFTALDIPVSNTNVNTCDNQLPFVWNGLSLDTTGHYSITLTAANGCDSIANLHLNVYPVSFSSSSVRVCSHTLPYLWNSQLLNSTGTYTATLTGINGCDSVATLQLTVDITPPPPTVVSPVTYCQFDMASALSASGSHPLLWYNNPSGSSSNSAPVPSTQTAGNFTYYVSQATSFCEGPQLPITVTVNSKPNLGNDKNIRLCYGDSLNLLSQYNTFGLTASWTQGNIPLTNPASIHQSGSYQLIISNIHGCSDTAQVQLTIQPEVVAYAGADADAEYNYPYQLQGSGGGSYSWTPAQPLNNPFSSHPLATLTEDTEFILMVTDEAGCKDYDSVRLRVLKGPTFYIPNAFTPNGDGLNDIFKPTPVGIARLEYFRVFNRYGELVYQTQDIGQGWDGTLKGIKQPIGGYVWMLKGTDRNGVVKSLKGNVVLVR